MLAPESGLRGFPWRRLHRAADALFDKRHLAEMQRTSDALVIHAVAAAEDDVRVDASAASPPASAGTTRG
jgi:hypothetical protein